MPFPAKRAFYSLAALFLFTITTAPAALADTVWLKNGDRISGDIVSMSEGSLLLKTKYAGQIKIAWDQVQNLASEKPLCAKTRDKGLVKGVAQKSAQGEMALGGQKVALAEISALNPPDETRWRFSGGVNLGMVNQEGNTTKQNWDIDGRLVARKTVHRFTVGMESHHEENKGKDTVDNDLLYANYNRFISEKWYALGDAQAFQDKFAGINSRYTGGVGMGYQVWQTDRTNLSVELGPSYVNEDSEIRADRDYFAARWALDFDYWIWRQVAQFFHRDSIFARVDDPEQYFYRTRTGLLFPLGKGFTASLQYNYDWDNDPNPGKDKEDSKFMLKLGYQW